MSVQEILSSNLNKTQKAYKLYDLGYTRRDVAEMITNGNYGFAHNIWKKWNDQRSEDIIPLPFEYTFTRSFGIELEIYGVSREKLISCMGEQGINIEGESYNHVTRTHWKIVSDSSIQGQNANEIVSPVLRGQEGMEQVKKVCIALNKAGAKVNKSCGFHVHFGADGLSTENMKNLVLSFIKLEKSFDAIMPKSRRENSNSYCQNISSINKIESKIKGCNTIESIANLIYTRYMKLNLQSYLRHGTIEFRQHSGTTTFSKIKSWILICGRLIEYTKQNGITNNLNYCLNESLQDYIADRAVDLAV